jgi:hypothetical protein
MDVKSVVNTPMANPIGAIAGGVAAYMGAKKLLKLENKWAVWGLAIAGVVVGATVQAKMKSKATLVKAVGAKA